MGLGIWRSQGQVAADYHQVHDLPLLSRRMCLFQRYWVGRSTRTFLNLKEVLGDVDRKEVEKVHVEPVTTRNKIKLQTRAIWF